MLACVCRCLAFGVGQCRGLRDRPQVIVGVTAELEKVVRGDRNRPNQFPALIENGDVDVAVFRSVLGGRGLGCLEIGKRPKRRSVHCNHAEHRWWGWRWRLWRWRGLVATPTSYPVIGVMDDMARSIERPVLVEGIEGITISSSDDPDMTVDPGPDLRVRSPDDDIAPLGELRRVTPAILRPGDQVGTSTEEVDRTGDVVNGHGPDIAKVKVEEIDALRSVRAVEILPLSAVGGNELVEIHRATTGGPSEPRAELQPLRAGPRRAPCCAASQPTHRLASDPCHAPSHSGFATHCNPPGRQQDQLFRADYL